jgi:alkanesulfonate monooxygenase SsuD/methylene tetrahydromethanopterin reductase-like flavin-dependent oxidoreductase (luciferase family)
MHVAMSVIFQNPKGPEFDDESYAAEYAFGDLAEPLGFDSLWAPEHHFTDYAMCPNPLQFLTYFAGRTKRIRLGTMVNVLPWHNLVRLAEDVAVLDHVSNGRYILGVGRGVAKVEFDRFRIDMNITRQNLIEGVQALMMGLEKGYIDYHGEVIDQPHALIRPRPARSFKHRIYVSALSPATYPLAGKLGLGLLFIPGSKPWNQVAGDLREYRNAFRETHGVEAPKPIFAGWVFVDEDEKRAREMGRKYIGDYILSAGRHYEMAGDHMKGVKGYEHYAAMAEMRGLVTEEQGIDAFVGQHVWGTPEQCFDKIRETREQLDAAGFIAVTKYSTMPVDEAIRNVKLFAAGVMPRVKALRPDLDIGVAPQPAGTRTTAVSAPQPAAK